MRTVCERHDLYPHGRIRSSLPGSHPVFIVEDRWVVKLFSDLFGGAQSFPVERDLYGLLGQTSTLPAPSLLASGSLFPEAEWPWPYLVLTCIRGRSLGEEWERVSREERRRIAGLLGGWLRELHVLPFQPDLFGRGRESYLDFLHRQRAVCMDNHSRWGTLPPHLLEQLPEYLLPVEALADTSCPPHLLHADLNGDHVLGEWAGEQWEPTGIIDFGDARAGDPLYEWVALHLGLLRCDKGLLQTFFEAYGGGDHLREDFARRAMCTTLLHEFNVLESVFEYLPEAAGAERLEDLGALVWGMGTR